MTTDDDKVESLAAHRAMKSGDAREWKVADALRAALQAVESGEIDAEMVYVAFAIPTPSDRRDYAFFAAGANKLEFAGLLYKHLSLVNDAH